MNPVDVARAAWGATLMVFPSRVLTTVHHSPTDPVDIVVARVLGARQLVQGVVTASSPGPELAAAGIYTDLTHASSMMGVALFSRRRRRAAITEAAIALGLAAAGSVDLPSAPTPSTNADAFKNRLNSSARRLLRRLPAGRLLLDNHTNRAPVPSVHSLATADRSR